MSKPDTERKRRYKSDLHTKKKFLNVHVSKDLKARLKSKPRSLLVHKGDKVKVSRGSFKGKTGKVKSVDYIKSKVNVEGLMRRNAKGAEVPVAFEPSNLLLVDLESTKERNEIFKVAPSVTKKDEVSSSQHVKVDSPVSVEAKGIRAELANENKKAKPAKIAEEKSVKGV